MGYGTHIPIDTIRMIACHSHIIAAVLGAASQPLNIGRASRTFNAATTRALQLRDKGCIFPGCDTPGQWTENHHITHWADGGNSDYTNGCLPDIAVLQPDICFIQSRAVSVESLGARPVQGGYAEKFNAVVAAVDQLVDGCYRFDDEFSGLGQDPWIIAQHPKNPHGADFGVVGHLQHRGRRADRRGRGLNGVTGTAAESCCESPAIMKNVPGVQV